MAEGVLTNQFLGSATDIARMAVKAVAEAAKLADELAAVQVEALLADLFDQAI